jgi:hypothetical protein
MIWQDLATINPWVLAAVVVWSLTWKGIALWQAALRGEKWWFVAFMIINTLGLLEIFYIYVIAPKPARARLL